MTEKSPGTTIPGAAQKYPTVEFLLRFGAAPAVIIYGLLFLAYRNYYTRVGVDPEEVGIDNAYILSRSAGFIFLFAIFVIFVVLSQVVDQGLNKKFSTIWIVALKTALTIPFGLFLVKLLTPAAPKPLTVLALVLVCGAQAVPLSLFRRHSEWASTIVYTLVLVVGVAVTAAALVSRAHFSAEQANLGCETEAVEYLSLPVLDLTASRVSVTWAGPQSQRPALFGTDAAPRAVEGLLIGRGSSADFVLVRSRDTSSLLKIPAALTITNSSVSASSRCTRVAGEA